MGLTTSQSCLVELVIYDELWNTPPMNALYDNLVGGGERGIGGLRWTSASDLALIGRSYDSELIHPHAR